MCVYVRTKFQVSSIILTSFKQVVIFPLPQNKPLKSSPRLGLKRLFKKIKSMEVTESIKSGMEDSNFLMMFK